jgi:hypothetical protein
MIFLSFIFFLFLGGKISRGGDFHIQPFRGFRLLQKAVERKPLDFDKEFSFSAPQLFVDAAAPVKSCVLNPHEPVSGGHRPL